MGTPLAKPSSEKASVRAVLLDVDGTLIDSNNAHAKAWQEVFQRHGHEISFDDVRHQIGKGGDQLMPVFLSKEEIEQVGKEIENERKELFKAKYLPHLKGFPSVRELVTRLLDDGKQVVLASSASGEELETYKKIAGIDDLIQAATSKDDAEKSKPHPDIFEAALAQTDGVAPEEAIVIGDSPYDAQAAGKAGLRCIGVLCGGFEETELREAGCMAVYPSIKDLLAAYESSPLAS